MAARKDSGGRRAGISRRAWRRTGTGRRRAGEQAKKGKKHGYTPLSRTDTSYLIMNVSYGNRSVPGDVYVWRANATPATLPGLSRSALALRTTTTRYARHFLYLANSRGSNGRAASDTSRAPRSGTWLVTFVLRSIQVKLSRCATRSWVQHGQAPRFHPRLVERDAAATVRTRHAHVSCCAEHPLVAKNSLLRVAACRHVCR